MKAITHFEDACEWTGVTDADRPAWLDARRSMLTASDVAAILGEDPRRDAWDVYLDKVQPVPVTAEEVTIHDPRFWGSRLERPIAEIVCDYYGWELQMSGALLRSKRHPWLGVTPDAEVLRSPHEGWILWQGKTTKIPTGWDEESGELPPRVLVQCQVELIVTRAPVDLAYGLVRGSEPHAVDVVLDDEFAAIVIEEGERFMDLVRRSEPPTPTYQSRRAIERLYPESDGSTVRLPPEGVEWTREIYELERQLEELAQRKEALRNHLRAAIGPASFGVLEQPVEGKAAWSNKLVRRSDGVNYRNLRAVKRAPRGGDQIPQLPPPELRDSITERLTDAAAQTTTIKKKRRRARR